LIYLAGDAHHFLIAGIGGSFSLVPLPFAQAQPALAQDLVEFFTRALFLVFEIAAPIAIALLLTNIALALMSRVAPQINVFAVGFPLQILVGLTMMLVSMPLLGAVLPAIYAQTPHQLDAVLRRLAVSP
jgi:flagellar biosynthetic protein FliR